MWDVEDLPTPNEPIFECCSHHSAVADVPAADTCIDAMGRALLAYLSLCSVELWVRVMFACSREQRTEVHFSLAIDTSFQAPPFTQEGVVKSLLPDLLQPQQLTTSTEADTRENTRKTQEQRSLATSVQPDRQRRSPYHGHPELPCHAHGAYRRLCKGHGVLDLQGPHHRPSESRLQERTHLLQSLRRRVVSNE